MAPNFESAIPGTAVFEKLSRLKNLHALCASVVKNFLRPFVAISLSCFVSRYPVKKIRENPCESVVRLFYLFSAPSAFSVVKNQCQSALLVLRYVEGICG
jgi:hypothetical protein